MKNYWLALLIAFASGPAPIPAQTVPTGLVLPNSAGAAGRGDAGYLVLPTSAAVGNDSHRVVPYQPQPGDILLYHMSKYETAFWLARAGPAMHAAIVFARPDGTPASLEMTGPEFWRTKVQHLDVGPRLRGSPEAVLVRQPRTPLTPAQSDALTRFALAQEGKEFALGRLFLQGTPFCCRTGLRRWMFGHTYLDRSRWICSEIVVAAAVSAGQLDAEAFPANAIVPSDLAYDETYNLSPAYHAPVLWLPRPSR